MTSNPHPIQPATDGSTLARGSDRIGLQDSIISSSWWWTKKFFLYYILLYGMNPHRRKLHCRNADRRNSANYDLTICNFDDLSFLGCHFRRSSYLSVYVFIYIYSECGRWSPKMKIADIDYRTKFGDLYVDCVSFDDVHFGDLSFRWCSFRREFRWSPPSVISFSAMRHTIEMINENNSILIKKDKNKVYLTLSIPTFSCVLHEHEENS
jgi:hypothetical protein